MAKKLYEDYGALAGDDEPVGPSHLRMSWNPNQGAGDVKIKQPPHANRFEFPRPSPEEMPREMDRADIDALIARIRAEEQLPPHKQNAAKTAALKQELSDLLRQQESRWVQRQADRLLPSLEEDQAGT